MWLQVTAALWIAAFVGLMFVAGWLAVRWLTARGTAEYRRDAMKLETISSLSLQQAKASAIGLLSDPRIFQCAESPIADERSLEGLAPEVRELLKRYATIELVKGPRAAVMRTSLGPSGRRPGFLRIGSIAAATDVAGDLGVKPGDETIYELYTDEAPDPTFGTYKSIYHWLLAMAEEAPESH